MAAEEGFNAEADADGSLKACLDGAKEGAEGEGANEG